MIGVTDDHELLYGYWDLNLRGSFGTEPSLWLGEVLTVGSGGRNLCPCRPRTLLAVAQLSLLCPLP